jgi:hypothetical protein
MMLFNHDAKEVYLPLYAIPREDLTGPVENITLRVTGGKIDWESSFAKVITACHAEAGATDT